MTRPMFAAASTPIGFVNFFEHIMPIEKAKKRYYLKGSSGSGKSTFMKKIAAEFESAGFDTEQFHCANDAVSLDAISVGSLGLSIIDATTPHASDPEIPVVIDRIVDFYKFINEIRITKHVNEIKSLLLQKKLVNEQVKDYFAALGKVYLAERTACEAALIRPLIKKLACEFIKSLNIGETMNYVGTDRKLFLRAVTPDGIISFADRLFNGCIVYGLFDETGTDIFLSELRDEANARGIHTESFYCPFAPGRLEYLYLPEIETAFAMTGGRFGYKGEVDKKIDIGCCINAGILHPDRERDNGLLDSMLNVTIDLMKSSRSFHNRIEEIYTSAIDFEGINIMTGEILQEILPKFVISTNK